MHTNVPSVLWHCWLGVRKSIRPVKNWMMGTGVVICLECGEWCKWFAYGPADDVIIQSTIGHFLLVALGT